MRVGIRCLVGMFGFLSLWSPDIMGEQSKSATHCPTLVTMLVTQFVFNNTVSELPRVEMRQCGSEEVLQLVAWKAKAKVPALVIDTSDFTVVQAVARDNVFLIETTGGPRNVVYVIAYHNGEPTLALKRVTKGTTAISMNETQLDIVISGIYAGDAESRTETHSFKMSPSDLFPKVR